MQAPASLITNNLIKKNVKHLNDSNVRNRVKLCALKVCSMFIESRISNSFHLGNEKKRNAKWRSRPMSFVRIQKLRLLRLLSIPEDTGFQVKRIRKTSGYSIHIRKCVGVKAEREREGEILKRKLSQNSICSDLTCGKCMCKFSINKMIMHA